MTEELVKTIAVTAMALAAVKLGLDWCRDSGDEYILDLDAGGDRVRLFRVDSDEVIQ